MSKKLLLIVFLILVVAAAFFIVSKNENQEKKFTSIDQVTRQDIAAFIAKNKSLAYWEENISNNMIGLTTFKDRSDFVILFGPAGASSSMYIPLYLNDGKLAAANTMFFVKGSAISMTFGYSKENDFFYQFEMSGNKYPEKESIPCGFIKYAWNFEKKEFIKSETVELIAYSENQCLNLVAEYGISEDTNTY